MCARVCVHVDSLVHYASTNPLDELIDRHDVGNRIVFCYTIVLRVRNNISQRMAVTVGLGRNILRVYPCRSRVESSISELKK